MKLKTKNFLLYWLPALLWTAVVFIFSSDAFSEKHTGSILEYVLPRIVGPIRRARFDLIQFLTRKSAHVTEYGILALMWLRAWRGAFAGWQLRWARQALAVCLAVAALDEFHQSFVPSRGSDVKDVALDAMGAALFLLMAFLHARHSAVGNRQSAQEAEVVGGRW